MKKFYDFIYNEKTASNTIFIGFGISLLMLLVFLIKGSWELKIEDSINEEKIGQFGDFFGGVIGTLFSLVGVILFYISLKEQRKDFTTNQKGLEMQLDAFKQQIKEFELQRDELKETRKIFEQQTKTMRNQQFESNFYSLLNVFINNRTKFVEKDLFENVVTKMRKDVSLESIDKTSKSIHSNYYTVYLANRADLAMYFMTLYRLFKIIEECPNFDLNEKTYYHKILRSQISKDELLVLYYNYHSNFGKKPLPIALKYNYFKHLEILSKLEFEISFKITTEETVHFNSILYRIREVIYSNIEKAKDLAENDVKEEIEIFSGAYLGIYIDEKIEIKLVIIKTDHNTVDGINATRYKEIIKAIVIDTLFSSRFKKFDSINMQESITTSETQIEHNFKFINQDD